MSGQEFSLADIRREIDAIDDGIVDLLVRRAAAQRKVKASKSATGSLAVSPVRPAREAEILRRIVARGRGQLSSQFLVRLWRQILVTSTLSQAAVRMHVSATVTASVELSGMLAAHACEMPLAVHGDVSAVIAAVASSPGDLGIVESASSWATSFAQGINGPARILGPVPVLESVGPPPLLLVGHADAQPTGEDCTLVITNRPFAGDHQWSVAVEGHRAICLGGFLDDAALAARGLAPTQDCVVAGRFPESIKVSSS